jgi:TonB family protein
VILAAAALSMQGCRSLGLRYKIASDAEGEHSPFEMDRILAAEVEKYPQSSLDRPLKAVRVTAPNYPKWVAREHTGRVLVRFTIGPEGKVTSVIARPEDNPELVKLVTDALMSWRFEPPFENGQPTSVSMKLPFKFEAW